jgi:SAM-dependent methyltransferase
MEVIGFIMIKILFLNNNKTNCGIYQYGIRVSNIISKSKRVSFIYKELDSAEEYVNIISKENPDGIIYNYNKTVMNWLTPDLISLFPNIIHYKISHDDDVLYNFNYFINSIVNVGNVGFNTPRPIFEDIDFKYDEHEIPIIGSFGFGFHHKGFDKICKLVNDQFDSAIIRLNITFPYYGDRTGIISKQIESECKKLITKENIQLEITHDFKNDSELLQFLSSNSINVFLYDKNLGGYSSAIDYAISVNRPIAISDSNMFSHIYDESICVDNHSLKEILNSKNDIFDKYREKWSNKNLIESYENIILNTIGIHIPMYNKILDDNQRNIYDKSIKELHELCPITIKRKIDRANIQQAFVLKTVQQLASKNSEILCVGSYDDTASESLIKLGYDVLEIDPVINLDLHKYYTDNPDKKFDIIISTSVIEHVEDDERFVDEICKLLKPNGFGILTCDFNDSYKIGEKPGEDFRLYTKHDLLIRLRNILISNGCDMYGNYNYDCVPDFVYSKYIYTFATYVIQKMKSY